MSAGPTVDRSSEDPVLSGPSVVASDSAPAIERAPAHQAPLQDLRRWLARTMDALGRAMRNPSFTPLAIVACAGLIGLTTAATGVVNVREVLGSFQWGILAILVGLDLFTQLIVGTGIMEAASLRLARWSEARRHRVLYLFAALVFLVSAFLNNITAVMVVLPILFVLLRAIELDYRYVAGFFALLLAMSNLGGAATPIGDFPAIVIMKSGLTDFSSYLFRAFPLFAATAIAVTLIHLAWLRRRSRNGGSASPAEQLTRQLATDFLAVQFRHRRVHRGQFYALVAVFTLMFLGWAILPADRFPPEFVAITGLALGAVLVLPRGASLGLDLDLKPVLTIGAFLFVAAVADNSGAMFAIADFLQSTIHDPTTLLVAVMVATALLTGLCSAGPTAAAMMPVILSLAAGPFQGQEHWLAVAFAASICAGSSLFLWSATAGFVLAAKIREAKLRDRQGRYLDWGISSYFRYGLVHFAVQLGIGIGWVLIATGRV